MRKKTCAAGHQTRHGRCSRRWCDSCAACGGRRSSMYEPAGHTDYSDTRPDLAIYEVWKPTKERFRTRPTCVRKETSQRRQIGILFPKTAGHGQVCLFRRHAGCARVECANMLAARVCVPCAHWLSLCTPPLRANSELPSARALRAPQRGGTALWSLRTLAPGAECGTPACDLARTTISARICTDGGAAGDASGQIFYFAEYFTLRLY